MKRLVWLLLALTLAGPAAADERWRALPPTPANPAPAAAGLAAVNGIQLYWAGFGPSDAPPVILLHGGLANSDWWGNQVPVLARQHRVIVVDSRGHGRSTRDAQPYSYGLMASDVLALMDQLRIPRAAIVGWSDGAIIGLDIAIHHPERLTRLFAFAGNIDPSGVTADLGRNATFNAFIARAGQQYAAISPTPAGYQGFLAAIGHMWASEPHYSHAQMRAIHVPVLIADGDHDEAIRRPHTEMMAALIPGAGLLIEPNVSHFAMLQDPGQFNADVLRFLDGG
jgi:pimeloyl-ACP methyl ester carboxylesterase